MYLGTIQVHTVQMGEAQGPSVWLSWVSYHQRRPWLPVTTLINLNNPGLQDFCSHVRFLPTGKLGPSR